MTRLSIIVPTAGRESLRRTLESIDHQRDYYDEVIVVGDTHDGPLPKTYALAIEFGARYIPHDAGAHDWGHSQLQVGIEAATGDYLVFTDDDDVATPNALADIRAAIAALDEPRPMLFRFRSWFGLIFWDQGGLIERNHVGGHCLVTPNLPGRVGRWAPNYTGDFDFVRSTIDLWPGGDKDVVWSESLIAWARPTEQEWQTLLRPKVEALV